MFFGPRKIVERAACLDGMRPKSLLDNSNSGHTDLLVRQIDNPHPSAREIALCGFATVIAAGQGRTWSSVAKAATAPLSYGGLGRPLGSPALRVVANMLSLLRKARFQPRSDEQTLTVACLWRRLHPA